MPHVKKKKGEAEVLARTQCQLISTYSYENRAESAKFPESIENSRETFSREHVGRLRVRFRARSNQGVRERASERARAQAQPAGNFPPGVS